MSANTNASSFPVLISTGDGRGGWSYQTCGGLTKRELFAAMALQGMLANQDISHSWKCLQEEAVRQADCLLARLDQEAKP